MMTREEILAHIRKLSCELCEDYDITISDDKLADKSYEIVNGYKYWPQYHMMLIGSRYVTWEAKGNKDTVNIDPYDPVHFTKIKELGMLKQKDNIIGIITFDVRGKMHADFADKKLWPDKAQVKEPERYISFHFDKDDVDIYYHIKYQHKMKSADMKLLAECLFLISRYDEEYFVPYKDQPWC